MIALMLRDLKLTFRAGEIWICNLIFFIIQCLWFLGLVLTCRFWAKSHGAFWVCALLACLLSLDRLFELDFEDGSLDLLLVAPFL